MEVKNENKMGTVPIPKLLISMSLPAIIAMTIQALYNIVDSIFVSRISDDALTALSLAFPIQMIIIAFFIGIGVGISSLVSRKLGEKNEKEASNVAEHGILIYLILYIMILLVAFVFVNHFFPLFTTNKNVIEHGTNYIMIIMLFSFGCLFAQAGGSILQGTGNMIYPMIAQVLGAVINIILDPIFIFGLFGIPAMGIRGAAIATVTAQIISMLYILTILITKEHDVRLNLKNFKFNTNITKGILAVGLPATIMQGIISVQLTGMNAILASFGEVPVRIFGVYFKLENFIFLPVFGLCQGTLPIIGYSFGSKNKERLMSTIKLATLMAISYMSFGMIIFLIFPVPLLNMFNSSDKMIELGTIAFRFISISFPVVAISIVFSTVFQGVGKAHIGLITSVLRQIILLPIAFLLGHYIGLSAVWGSFIIAELVVISVLGFIVYNYKNTLFQSIAPIPNTINLELSD